MQIDLEDKAVAASAKTQQTSGSLSLSSDIGAALDEIEDGAPSSTTRMNTGWQRRGGFDPAAELQRMIERSRQEVEAASKAEADNAATTGQTPQPRPDKRNRTRSDGPQSGPGKGTVTAQATTGPAPTNPDSMDMRQDTQNPLGPTSFEQPSKPIRLPCAVVINDNEIMGNPFEATPGWSVKVDLDAGAQAQPSIGLDFSFPKVGVSSRKAKDQNNFTIGWEPGVKIGGNWQLEALMFYKAAEPADLELADATFPPEIQELMKGYSQEEQAYLRSNLVYASFISNAHRTTPMQPDWALALDDDKGKIPYANLQSMYQGEDQSYHVSMWFINRNLLLERFDAVCLTPLYYAVLDHTPPFHQFLDENDEPMIDFNLEKIHPVANGIYRRYPKVLAGTDRRVENRLGELTLFRLGKTVTWESIKMLHTSASTLEEEKEQKQFGGSIPYAQRGSKSSRGTSRKAPKSPADFEMLRLKDRQSLHRLDPS